MFDEVMRKVKEAGFRLKDIITDKDSSVNSIFCRYFPEGMITYCSLRPSIRFVENKTEQVPGELPCNIEIFLTPVLVVSSRTVQM